MAQRDEGLDNLEAFIAAAAATGAALQRDGERVRAQAQRLDQAEVDARLEELDRDIEAFDAQHGDLIEAYVMVELILLVGIPLATAGGGGLLPFVIPLSFLAARELRHRVVCAADDARVAYDALCAAAERIDHFLAEAGDDAREAFDAFEHAADAGGEEIDHLAEAAGQGLEEMGVGLASHFPGH